MPKFVEGCAARLIVPEGQRDIQVFDDALPGFGIRKFASGKASYFVKFNVGTKQRRLTLGKVVQGNLAEMRKRASTVLAKARLGQDSVAEKRTAASVRSVTLGALVVDYLAQRQPKLRPRYYAEVKRQLERDWRPLHGHVVSTITRQEIVSVVDDIATGQGEVAADRARTALGFSSAGRSSDTTLNTTRPPTSRAALSAGPEIGSCRNLSWSRSGRPAAKTTTDAS